MTDALARLIQYPANPVFDDSPRPALALRVRHSSVLVIEVADATLRLTSDVVVREYALDDYTIAELADALTADGFDVVFESSEYGRRSARCLLGKSANQDDSNGDHLHVYTSLLWGLFDAYGVQIDHQEYEVQQALRQMVITQSEGYWLDVWATLYGVLREDGETDAALQARLPKEVFRVRVNGIAIEQTIKDLTTSDVEIFEPWKLMFRLDESALSGAHRFTNQDYYNYHVIQPVGHPGVDWARVLKIVDRNRAAGVLVYPQRTILPGSVIVADYGDETVRSCRVSCSATHGRYDDRTFLDYSLIEDVPVLNHAALHRKGVLRLSRSRLVDRSWLDAIWPQAAWDAMVAVIGSKHSRSYRVHYLDVHYLSRPWAAEVWSGPWNFSTTIRGKHSQLS